MLSRTIRQASWTEPGKFWGSDIDWGDRGREIERRDHDRVKAYWGLPKVGEPRRNQAAAWI
jgi:hypothetical protein